MSALSGETANVMQTHIQKVATLLHHLFLEEQKPDSRRFPTTGMPIDFSHRYLDATIEIYGPKVPRLI